MVTGVYVDSPTDFVVDSRAIAKRDDGKVTCTITNPSGARTENFITPLADGTYKISYTPFEEGKHIHYDERYAFTENVKHLSCWIPSSVVVAADTNLLRCDAVLLGI